GICGEACGGARGRCGRRFSSARRCFRNAGSTPSSPSSAVVMASERIPSLDGLRAISIALVLVSHLISAGHALGALGDLGVRFFFTISGFLITNILLREIDATGG